MLVKLHRIQRPLSSLESMCPAGCKDIEYYEGCVLDPIVNNTHVTVVKHTKRSELESGFEKRIAVQVFRRDEVYGTQFREPTKKEMVEILRFVGWNSVEKIGASDDRAVHLYRLNG